MDTSISAAGRQAHEKEGVRQPPWAKQEREEGRKWRMGGEGGGDIELR